MGCLSFVNIGALGVRMKMLRYENTPKSNSAIKSVGTEPYEVGSNTITNKEQELKDQKLIIKTISEESKRVRRKKFYRNVNFYTKLSLSSWLNIK